MKSISTWFNGYFSDDELLKEAIHEMKEFSDTGILKDGVVRKAIRVMFQDYANIPMYDCQRIITNLVIERAAYKWAGIK